MSFHTSLFWYTAISVILWFSCCILLMKLREICPFMLVWNKWVLFFYLSNLMNCLSSGNDCQRPTWSLACVRVGPMDATQKFFPGYHNYCWPLFHSDVRERCQEASWSAMHSYWLSVTATDATWDLICHGAEDFMWSPDVSWSCWLLCLTKYSEKSLCIHGLFTQILLLSPNLFDFQMAFALYIA